MSLEDHWSLGRWGRIPVAMHWTVLLAFAWMYIIFWDIAAALLGAVAFFVVLVAHELGHVAVLRAKRLRVDSITLYGLHGRTEAYTSARDEMVVAWGGVAAQLLLLALAFPITAGLKALGNPWALWIWGPMFVVFTQLNIFVMIIALLPIGPFDGRAAWRVIPYWRDKLRRKRRRVVRREPEPEPPKLTPEEQRALEAHSERAAAELIEKLAKKK